MAPNQYERSSAQHTNFFNLNYYQWAPIAMSPWISDPPLLNTVGRRLETKWRKVAGPEHFGEKISSVIYKGMTSSSDTRKKFHSHQISIIHKLDTLEFNQPASSKICCKKHFALSSFNRGFPQLTFDQLANINRLNIQGYAISALVR